MKRIAVFFVGNRLMLDDGVGPAAYDLICEEYVLPRNVDMFDVGCMSLDMISKVDEYDFMITVDAVDGSGSEPGTVFRYRPHDIARTCGARTSLHDTKLADLFDAAALLGYTSEGMCYGMQVLNLEPAEFMEGLTQPVADRLPFLAESVIAELVRQGCSIERKDGVPLPELLSEVNLATASRGGSAKRFSILLFPRMAKGNCVCPWANAQGNVLPIGRDRPQTNLR